MATPAAASDTDVAPAEWRRDDEHMPFALRPLAADYVLAMGDAFGAWCERYSGGAFGSFSQPYSYRVVDGYAYIGSHEPADEADRADLRNRSVELGRWRAQETAAWWRDEVLPELEGCVRVLRDAPVEHGSPAEAVAGWDDGWAAFHRMQELHFDVTIGPMSVLDDLAALLMRAVPGTAVTDVDALIHGRRHEWIDVDLDLAELVEAAGSVEPVATALRGGMRSLDELRALEGGAGVVGRIEAFLERHGHVGQSADDLALASWGEEPASLVTEIARRLDHPPEPTAARLERQAREADALADRARAGLAAEPDEVARFDALLRLAREIGPIVETHNYWIDRRSQAAMRRLAMAAGRRLTAEGVLAQPFDVLYLHRDEVRELLARPVDRRALLEERRAIHRRQLEATPPAVLVDAAADGAPAAAAEEALPDDGLLRGAAASPGIVRGPARVVLSSDDFDRVQPGDIVVCPSSNPSWITVFMVAAGLVTNAGGILCHAAVTARELGLPAVTGAPDATSRIVDGQLVELDGAAGTLRIVPSDPTS